MTVEQCELLSLPKSYHCIQGEEIGVWPLVPKNKIFVSFLMAIPTQQRIGGGGAAEKGLRKKSIVGFILNHILCSSLPQHHHPTHPQKSDQGCVCACVNVFIQVCACVCMLGDGILLSQTLLWPSTQGRMSMKQPSSPPPNLRVLEVPAGAEELDLGE